MSSASRTARLCDTGWKEPPIPLRAAAPKPLSLKTPSGAANESQLRLWFNYHELTFCFLFLINSDTYP